MAFTVHGVSAELEKRLDERARREKKSRNALAKELLARAGGLGAPDRRDDHCREFLGLWSKGDLEAFRQAQADNEKAREGDWR